MTVVRRSLLVLLAAFVTLTVAACGDDDDGGNGGASAGSVEEYCDLAAQIDELGVGVSEDADPEVIERVTKEQLAVAQEAAAVAPPEISADFAVLVGVVEDYVEIAEDNGWDAVVTAADPRFADIMESQEVADASARVDAFNAEQCGLEADATTSTTAPTTTTSTSVVVDTSDPNLAAYCAAAEQLDVLDDEAVTADDPAQFEQIVTQQYELAQQTAQVAPAQISADFAVLVGALGRLIEIGDAVGWDALALSQDPDFAALNQDAEVMAAGDAVRAYNEAACGVVAD